MTSRVVLRSYFAISGVYTLSASLIWSVNTLFLLDAGLDIFGVFIAGAAFTAGNVLFEIPTGVVADTVGRRTSFLLSVSILCVGTLAYVAIPYAAWNPLLLFSDRVRIPRARLQLLLRRGRGVAGGCAPRQRLRAASSTPCSRAGRWSAARRC